MRAIRCGASRTVSIPSISTEPLRAPTSPMIARSVVVASGPVAPK